jgi:hypothetical protein
VQVLGLVVEASKQEAQHPLPVLPGQVLQVKPAWGGWGARRRGRGTGSGWKAGTDCNKCMNTARRGFLPCQGLPRT